MQFFQISNNSMAVVFMAFLILSAYGSSVPGVYFEEIGHGACAEAVEGSDNLQLPYFTNYNAAEGGFSDISDDQCATLCGEQDECLGYFQVFGMCFLYHAQGTAFENPPSGFDAGNEEHLGTDVTVADVTFSDLAQPNSGICYKKMITPCDDPIGSASYINGYVWDTSAYSFSDCTAQTDGCANPIVTGVSCAEGYLANSGISVTQCSADDLSTELTGCVFVKWNTGDWSKCTANNGKKFRDITCSTGNEADCESLESKPSHITGDMCNYGWPDFHFNQNNGRCTTWGGSHAHRRCQYIYENAQDDCRERCVLDEWCRGYAYKNNVCELATEGNCGVGSEHGVSIGDLVLTGGGNGLHPNESPMSGCFVKISEFGTEDIFQYSWKKENLLLTKPTPTPNHIWIYEDGYETFWFSQNNAEKFFSFDNWANFDWEVTYNKFEDNRIAIRVVEETHVLIVSNGGVNVGEWQNWDSSSGEGVHDANPFGEWERSDILTNPVRLCRLGPSSYYSGYDISGVELYHCGADEGGCDDYVIQGALACAQGYALTGEISVQQCTGSNPKVSLTGCEPVVCSLPEVQEGYAFETGASISGCDTVDGCDDMVISGVSCDDDYGFAEGATLSAVSCSLEDEFVELTGCTTIVEVHMCGTVDEDHAPAICATISEELGSTNPVDCMFGEECDVTDGTRRFLQSGIRIVTRASVPNAEEAIAILEHPDFLENIDWESAGLDDFDVSLVHAMQQPTAAPTALHEIETATAAPTATVFATRETEYIIIGLLSLIVVALFFHLCTRNSASGKPKLLDVENTTKTPQSVSIVCSDVNAKRTPKGHGVVQLDVETESSTPTE